MRPRSQREVVGNGAAALSGSASARASRLACVGRPRVVARIDTTAVPGMLQQSGACGRHRVAPTSITAWVQSAGPIRRHRRVRQALHLDGVSSPASPATIRPRTRRTFVSTAPTGSPERQRRDGPRGIRPDSGQRLEVGQIGRHPAAELVDDPVRRAPQVERAPVVAEALPRPEDIGRRGGRQRLDRREAVHEASPRVTRPGGLRLLGHRLGHEDRVRVRAAAERKGPGARDVPVEDRVAERGREVGRSAHRPTIGDPSLR